MWPYLEYALGHLLSNQRGRDAKLFNKSPAFANLPSPSLEVTSPDCGPSKSNLSTKYGKDGGNMFPALSWQPPGSVGSVEGEVQEYMLIVEDPDAPLPNPITHGVYYAIPAGTQSVDASCFEPTAEEPGNTVKGGFKYGQNRMKNIYGGPRPVLGHGPHRYFYQVIALREKVDQKSFATNKPTREELAKAVEGKVLAWGEWVGHFERRL